MKFVGKTIELKEIDKRSLSLRVLVHSLAFSLVSISSALIILIVAVLIWGGPDKGAENVNVGLEIFVNVISVPLIETIFFQFLIIWAFSKIQFLRPAVIIAISAVLFAVYHRLPKAIIVLPLGIVLAYVFCYWWEKTENLKWAFAATYLTHALHNLYSFLLNFIPPSFFKSFID